MQKDSKGKTIIAVAAIVAFLILGLAYLSQPTTLEKASTAGDTEADDGGDGGSAVQPASIIVSKAKDTETHRGTVTISLGSAVGTTGTTSTMLFLNTKHAAFGADKKLDRTVTREAIMKTISDSGLIGLTAAIGGSPSEKSASSGAWSETITGKTGDQILLYTAADATPGAAENASTVELITLGAFSPGTDTWTVTTESGVTSWNLYDYANYSNSDNNIAVINYTYNDGNTADSNIVLTWYMNATANGGDCIDCAVFVMAPENYSTVMKDLVLTAKGLEEGYSGTTSIKFTASDLLPSSGSEARIAAGTLPSKPSANDELYFLGFIPERFQTLRTSADKNELQWSLKTDTYANDVGVTFYIVHNAHSKSTSNGAFRTPATNGMTINYADDGITGFNIRE